MRAFLSFLFTYSSFLKQRLASCLQTETQCLGKLRGDEKKRGKVNVVGGSPDFFQGELNEPVPWTLLFSL